MTSLNSASSPRQKSRFVEAFADQLVRGCVGMQCVRQWQAGVVVRAVELGAVEVVDVGIGRLPLLDDGLQLFADDAQCQLALADFALLADGAEQQAAFAQRGGVEQAGTGRVFVDRAVQRRDRQQRCVRMAIANGVQEAVHGRCEGAQTQQVGVDQVDADFHADQVGRQVAHGAGCERVQQGVAAEAEIEQVDAGESGRYHGPDAGWTGGIRTRADGTAVVQPLALAGRGQRRDGGVGAQVDQFGGFVVRQPDVDGFIAVGQVGEVQRLRCAWLDGGGAGGQVDLHDFTAGDAELARQLAIDVQIVDAIRPRRHADVSALGG